jgi:hypothetical protein
VLPPAAPTAWRSLARAELRVAVYAVKSPHGQVTGVAGWHELRVAARGKTQHLVERQTHSTIRWSRMRVDDCNGPTSSFITPSIDIVAGAAGAPRRAPPAPVYSQPVAGAGAEARQQPQRDERLLRPPRLPYVARSSRQPLREHGRCCLSEAARAAGSEHSRCCLSG